MPRHHVAESRTSPRRLKAAERQRQALELRIAGATFDQIAQTVGYHSRQAAHCAVESALRKTLQEAAGKARELDTERLDRMLFRVWQAVRDGNLGAVDRALRILERRAKLLGLDAPVKQVLTGEDGKPLIPDYGAVLLVKLAALEGVPPQLPQGVSSNGH